MDSAVSSLLGQLKGLLVDEAKLLSGVRKDVQFIKDEMESMQGFLLDAADAGNNSHQVMAWRRQVREVAYGSQRCMDHYVQTLGASRPTAGLLGSVGRLPQLVRTMPSRHRIANRIKDLKARAQEVGERRQRYGVKAPIPTPSGSVVHAAGRRGAPAVLSAQQKASEHARRRRDIADATDWVNSDAQHVMEWIAASGDQKVKEAHHHEEGARRRLMQFFSDLPGHLHIPHFTTENLVTGLLDLEVMGNKADATAFLWEHTTELFEGKWSLLSALKDLLWPSSSTTKHEAAADKGEAPHGHHHHRFHVPFLNRRHGHSEDDHDHHHANETPPPSGGADVDPSDQSSAAHADVEEDHGHAAATSRKMKMSREEAQGHKHRINSWLRRVLKSDGIHLVHKENVHQHGPRLLAIVTPPVNQQNLEDGEPQGIRRATEIARRVYDDYSRQGSRFDFTVWVDAERRSDGVGRLASILEQVQRQSQVLEQQAEEQHLPQPPSAAALGDEMKRLQQEIRKHLEGKKFLIFLADHQDETPWTQILPALPSDDTDQSAIILSPLVQEAYQYVGWYVLSMCFLPRHSRYRVYFYSHLVATRNKAGELLRAGGKHRGEDDLHGVVNQILTRCRWDSFSSKMFLHALYANPRRSKPDLENLLRSLYEFSTVSNIRNIIGFCYDDLPYHYKACFQYLSNFFPSESKMMRRTSLVRRWAAEGLVVGRDGQAATDEAERCFDALIDRGLLLPTDNIVDTPSGKVKMCTVHPHVGSFMTRLPRVDSGHAAAADIDVPPSLAHRLSTPCGIQLSNKTWRRASEGLKKQMGGPQEQDSVSEGMMKLLGLFPTSESGWIKVLDLESCRGLTKKHLKSICNKAFQLRYLSLRNTGMAELPREINKLQDLETLDIRGTNIDHFPAKSIVLPKLAHLLSGGGYSDGRPSHGSSAAIHITRGIKGMANMRILSHVMVSDGDHEAALDDLARLQVLWKLGVVIHRKKAQLLLKVLGMLNECLRSLSIRIVGDGEVPDLTTTPPVFSPPRSLTSFSICGMIGGLPTWLQKLEQLSDITLCDTSLKDSDIKILAALINLRFIRLLRESYNQKKLSFEKGFRNLEFLVIQGSGAIADVHFDPRVAPKLEKIAWSSTRRIENLGIDNLQGIREIELEGECDLNCIRKSVQANPCHPKLTLISPTLDAAPAFQLAIGERAAAATATATATGTSATNK